MSNIELLERVVEVAAECRDGGMNGGEFVSLALALFFLFSTAKNETAIEGFLFVL